MKYLNLKYILLFVLIFFILIFTVRPSYCNRVISTMYTTTNNTDCNKKNWSELVKDAQVDR